MGKSANPRVNVTVPQETFDVLKSYSELLDKRVGTIVAEFLVESTPLFQDILSAAEMAKKSEADALAYIQSKFYSANVDLMQQTLELGKKND